MCDPDADQSEDNGANRTTCYGDGSTYEARDDPIDKRWISDIPVLDATLPEDVQILLGRLLDDKPVETLGGWVSEVRRRTGGGAITVEDLCHTDTESPHRGVIGDDIYHVRCFYDAVILAALVDEPVDIRTESPRGRTIKAVAAGTNQLQVTPEEAVFSFGVAESVEPPHDGGPSNADVYATVCPYVRAFPDAEAYERWARDISAATVALPLEGATDVAAGLVE